ncbi:MAG TPA: OmpA family protein [Thermoanaerobaculia bacterium]|nr:OmpA family protein [Thermoanaerobaculia bacterium]
MRIRTLMAMVGLLFMVAPAVVVAQVTASPEQIDSAATALAEAERVGAPIYAKELYDEANWRLRFARENETNRNRSSRHEARLRAIEARYAAEAATARAEWVRAVNDATALRTEIQRLGGTVPALNLDTDDIGARGTTLQEKVDLAEIAIARARAAGADAFAGAELREGDGRLETARKILRAQSQNTAAEHLAFITEMSARRAYYRARMRDVETVMPGLKLERTRLAQIAGERAAADERLRRSAAEREAADLRARLEAESRRQLELDRAARLAAEQQLDILMRQYEGARTTAEIEALRRQVEQQQAALRDMQQRELRSEEAFGDEIARLRQTLERERVEGRLGAQALAEREADMTRQQAELDRVRRERAGEEQRRLELQRAHDEAIRRAQQRIQETEAEVGQLKQQVVEERAKAQLATAEAERLRLEQELQKIAQTRTESRGLVVTLPGIYFATGQSTLTPGARNVLQKITEQLRGNDRVRVMIEGHTDSVGSAESNQALSLRRAEAVRDALAGFGMPSAAITVSGRGEDVPVATNATAAGRQQNRRVELIITETN